MADNINGLGRAEKKREQIRAAAQQLFLKYGFQGTSTDAIMAAAGIASKETLYRYYPGKEELFVDVLQSLTLERPHFHQLIAAATHPETIQELETLLKTATQVILETMFQPEYLAVVRVIMAELPRFPQLGPLYRQAVPEQAQNYLLALLSEGQQASLVQKDLDLQIAARMLLGTLLTFVLFEGLFSGETAPPVPDPAVVDSLVTNYMRVITPPNGK